MIKTKYNSKKIEYLGNQFDSKMEMDYFIYLLGDESVDKIDLQPTFQLQEPFIKYGKRHRAVTYTPDFEVTFKDGTVELIDIKGFSTQQGDMRRKMFDYHYPNLTLKWITYVKKHGGWVETDELKKIRKENKKSLNK